MDDTIKEITISDKPNSEGKYLCTIEFTSTKAAQDFKRIVCQFFGRKRCTDKLIGQFLLEAIRSLNDPLNEFHEWAKKNPPMKTDLEALKGELAKDTQQDSETELDGSGAFLCGLGFVIGVVVGALLVFVLWM